MTLHQRMTFITWISLTTYILLVAQLSAQFFSLSVQLETYCQSSFGSEKTGVYLIGLAIADVGVLVFFFVSDSLEQLRPELDTNDTYAVFYSYIGYPLFYLCVVCSIWTTVGVTVDRYIQVCWIARAKVLLYTFSLLTSSSSDKACLPN